MPTHPCPPPLFYISLDAPGLCAQLYLVFVCVAPTTMWTGSYMASFLLSLEIQLMNFIYKKVAVWTTQRENHRTDTVFEDVLIAKLAVFQVCCVCMCRITLLTPTPRRLGGWRYNMRPRRPNHEKYVLKCRAGRF